MENGKVWWKSKTVWANIVIFIIWAISIVQGITDNKLYLAVLVVATLVLELVLRYLTGQPITLRDLQAIADKARELQKEYEARSNPASMKSEPWPAPVLPPEIRSQWNGDSKPPPGG